MAAATAITVESNKRRRVDSRSPFLESALKSTRLWLNGGSAGLDKSVTKGDDESNAKKGKRQQLRTPADVARLRFFDGPKIDSTEVERHILTAGLWSIQSPNLVRGDDSLDLRLTPELWSRIEQFDCWPRSASLPRTKKWDAIRSACRVFRIDDLPHWSPSEEDFDDKLNRMAEWLSGCDGEKRMWRNRILAAVLSIQTRERSTAPPPLSRVEQHVDFARLPGDVLTEIFEFAGGASSARIFSATSSQCRTLVRSNPQTAGMWRRNLFFAKCSNRQTSSREWKVLCAEDCPDSRLAPTPLDAAFSLPEAQLVGIGCGGICQMKSHYLPISARKMKDNIDEFQSVLEDCKQSWHTQNPLFTDRTSKSSVNLWREYRTKEILPFFSKSPFGPSVAPMAVCGARKAGTHNFIMAFVGCDDYGGFIGACIRNCSDLTVCGRYLQPNDSRLDWPVERILVTLLGSENEAISPNCPWTSSLFDLHYEPTSLSDPSPALGAQYFFPQTASDSRKYAPAPLPLPKSSKTVEKHWKHALAPFELKLRLTCDLRRFAEDYIHGISYDNTFQASDTICFHCGEFVHAAPIQCTNSNVEGFDESIKVFAENGVSFCSNKCFLDNTTELYDGSPCHYQSNVTWEQQCWGCGKTENTPRLMFSLLTEGEREEGYEKEDGRFGKDAQFCDKKCLLRALPEMLRFCKEWQVHDFTKGHRDLYVAAAPVGVAFEQDVLSADHMCSLLLKRGGWEQELDQEWLDDGVPVGWHLICPKEGHTCEQTNKMQRYMS